MERARANQKGWKGKGANKGKGKDGEVTGTKITKDPARDTRGRQKGKSNSGEKGRERKK